MHEGIGIPGLINDLVLVGLSLFRGLGHSRFFDSDAPILVYVLEVADGLEGLLLLVVGGQVSGEAVKIISYTQEENEEKMIFAEKDVEHLEKWEVETGVI